MLSCFPAWRRGKRVTGASGTKLRIVAGKQVNARETPSGIAGPRTPGLRGHVGAGLECRAGPRRTNGASRARSTCSLTTVKISSEFVLLPGRTPHRSRKMCSDVLYKSVGERLKDAVLARAPQAVVRHCAPFSLGGDANHPKCRYRPFVTPPRHGHSECCWRDGVFRFRHTDGLREAPFSRRRRRHFSRHSPTPRFASVSGRASLRVAGSPRQRALRRGGDVPPGGEHDAHRPSRNFR
jgi:hypothetical protein